MDKTQKCKSSKRGLLAGKAILSVLVVAMFILPSLGVIYSAADGDYSVDFYDLNTKNKISSEESYYCEGSGEDTFSGDSFTKLIKDKPKVMAGCYSDEWMSEQFNLNWQSGDGYSKLYVRILDVSDKGLVSIDNSSYNSIQVRGNTYKTAEVKLENDVTVSFSPKSNEYVTYYFQVYASRDFTQGNTDYTIEANIDGADYKHNITFSFPYIVTAVNPKVYQEPTGGDRTEITGFKMDKTTGMLTIENLDWTRSGTISIEYESIPHYKLKGYATMDGAKISDVPQETSVYNKDVKGEIFKGNGLYGHFDNKVMAGAFLDQSGDSQFLFYGTPVTDDIEQLYVNLISPDAEGNLTVDHSKFSEIQIRNDDDSNYEKCIITFKDNIKMSYEYDPQFGAGTYYVSCEKREGMFMYDAQINLNGQNYERNINLEVPYDKAMSSPLVYINNGDTKERFTGNVEFDKGTGIAKITNIDWSEWSSGTTSIISIEDPTATTVSLSQLKSGEKKYWVTYEEKPDAYNKLHYNSEGLYCQLVLDNVKEVKGITFDSESGQFIIAKDCSITDDDSEYELFIDSPIVVMGTFDIGSRELNLNLTLSPSPSFIVDGGMLKTGTVRAYDGKHFDGQMILKVKNGGVVQDSVLDIGKSRVIMHNITSQGADAPTPFAIYIVKKTDQSGTLVLYGSVMSKATDGKITIQNDFAVEDLALERMTMNLTSMTNMYLITDFENDSTVEFNIPESYVKNNVKSYSTDIKELSYYVDGKKVTYKYDDKGLVNDTWTVDLSKGTGVSGFTDENGVPITQIIVQQGKSYDLGKITVTCDDDYSFDGWYADSTYKQKIDVAQPYTPTEDTTIYAKAVKETPSELTVTFKNGTTGETVKVEKVTKGSTVAEPDVETPTGQTKLGWYTATAELWDFDTDVVNSNLTLTVVFKEIKSDKSIDIDVTNITDDIELNVEENVTKVNATFSNGKISIDNLTEGVLELSIKKVQTSSDKYDVVVKFDGQEVSGQTITIQLHYDTSKGEPTLYYYKSATEKVKMDASFDASTGMATFTTTHNSTYGFEYADEPEPEPEPQPIVINKNDCTPVVLLGIFILAVLAIIALCAKRD